MKPIFKFLAELQEVSLLIARIFVGITKTPRYFPEILKQMDLFGVQSVAIIMLTGFFIGGVLTLQGYPTLAYFGGQSQTGMLVASSMIRELGPVISALMIAGKVGSSISAELGSMVVSQQIDAMRALGTDPVRKLVTPRVIALVLMLPVLVIIADMVGLFGAAIVGKSLFGLDYNAFISTARSAIEIEDLIGGMIKPLFFGFIIGVISCHKGLSTTGGTVGVGRSTTSAVVISSITVIVADFFLSRVIQVLLKQ